MTMSRIRKYKNLYTAGDNLHSYAHLVMFIRCKVGIFDDSQYTPEEFPLMCS